jgi:hypothetical protein
MKKIKAISGTFVDGVSNDMASNNWTREDWVRQFDNFVESGIDTVIIIRVGWNDSAMYKSEIMNTTLYEDDDLIEVMLREADRCKIKMYMGLFDSHKYWLVNDWQSEIDINTRLIEELWERYKHHESFYGWYMSHEGDLMFHPEKVWKPLINKARSYDHSKKIMISPRYCGPKYDPRFIVSPEQHFRHFDYIFSQIGDILDEAAFMDGHVHFKDLESYVAPTAEVCKKYGVSFWSNLETFDRDLAWKHPPIEWIKLKHKLEVVQPYVDKIITFEAPHFLSPYSHFISARNLYRRYMNYIK